MITQRNLSFDPKTIISILSISTGNHESGVWNWRSSLKLNCSLTSINFTLSTSSTKKKHEVSVSHCMVRILLDINFHSRNFNFSHKIQPNYRNFFFFSINTFTYNCFDKFNPSFDSDRAYFLNKFKFPPTILWSSTIPIHLADFVLYPT